MLKFYASSRKSENVHFDGLFQSKSYKFLDEKVQKSYVSWLWKVMQSLKKNWLLTPNMARGMWWVLMQAVTSLKICTLMCYFRGKYIMFKPKKYRRVLCHNTEEWRKIWRGTDLCLEKWHQEFGEFWPNTRKSQSLHFELKKYRRVMRNYIEDWCKPSSKNYLWFHKWHDELGELDRSAQKY